jgi:CHAP domain
MAQRGSRLLSTMLLAAALAVTACASSAARVAAPTSTLSVTPSPTADANRYTDAKLGFSLDVPSGWRAEAQPGSLAPVSTAAVTLVGDESAHTLVTLGVTEGSSMPAAFAQLAARGLPQERIGEYPAFSDDRTRREARVLCLVRIFLAGQDYVMADWCAMDAPAHAAEFEQLLATFQPAAPGFLPHPVHAPAAPDCAGMQAQLGYTTPATWGRQLGAATATRPAVGWAALAPGVTVCDNEGSADQYLFQCTELANRFLYTRWALAHIPGNAARYYDYYQDGVLHPGVVRDFPEGSYAFADDASQGTSAFAPRPSDLLIFQDVTDPRVGWTSSLTTSPGHVAVITAVDATRVYVAQENYSQTAYFQALPLAHTARGWAITDLSGISNRIVRGWIHFTVNGGA